MQKIVIAGSYTDKARGIMIDAFRDFRTAFVAREEEFAEHPDADCVILRTLRMDGGTIRKMQSLRFIQRWGAGLDTVDLRAAGEAGVAVAGAAGVNAPAVAELTVGLMLALCRKIVLIHEALHRGEWIKSVVDKQSSMINGKTVGIIGGGSIGMLVGKYLSAMNAKVIVHDAVRNDSGFRFVALDELLGSADIITLHVPLTGATRHMIDRPQFALMKQGAMLVNTARGGIVNEDALAEALDSGRLAGAALDCFETEPLPGDSPLLKYPNVVATCHVGGNTADLMDVMAEYCVGNVIAFFKGELPASRVANREFLAGKA